MSHHKPRYKPPSTKGSVRGFTLIEVLLALAIFASLSMVAYQVVYQVQLSNQQSALRTERMQDIQRLLVVMDNDFRQIALRQFRHNGNEPSEQLIQWQDQLLDSEQHGLLFSRAGWSNPAGQFPRGEIVKVGYRISEESLERLWWRYPDTTVGQPPLQRTLITGVDAFSVTFFDGQGWQKEWNQALRLPKAVTVSLTLQDYGKIERVYLTGGGELWKDQSATEATNNG